MVEKLKLLTKNQDRQKNTKQPIVLCYQRSNAQHFLERNMLFQVIFCNLFY